MSMIQGSPLSDFHLRLIGNAERVSVEGCRVKGGGQHLGYAEIPPLRPRPSPVVGGFFGGVIPALPTKRRALRIR